MPSGIKTFGTRISGRAYEPRPGCYGVARGPDRQVLVVETPDLKLYLPGGGQRPGETDGECLEREFREETGHTITVGRPLGQANQLVHALEEPSGFLKQCRFFLVDLLSEGPSLEADGRILWVERWKARDRLHEEAHRWALSLV